MTDRIGYVALGSNHEPESRHLAFGIAGIATIGPIVHVSTVYQTKAIGLPGQPDYLNAVCAFRTTLPPKALRGHLKAIEQSAGRIPGHHPVTLDLDLCLLGDLLVASHAVTLPHPDLLTRPALALGLAELDPTLRHPGTGETFATIAARLLARESAPIARRDIRLLGAGSAPMI